MNNLDLAISILRRGGVVIFPTETAYGIGCRMDEEKAVKKLIKIRGREPGKPFLVLAAKLQMAKKYWQKLPQDVENLAKKFWPGPLTIVYYCQKDLVPRSVRAGGDTLGIRVPPDEIPLALINGVGVPLLAPSANFTGGQTSFKLNKLDSELIKKVDFVLKLPCGGFKEPSTVIDCTRTPFQILRQGVLKKEAIFC